MKSSKNNDIKTKKEGDEMSVTTVEYNKDIFLSELEESLKEMRKKRNSKAEKNNQSSWRDLFTTEKE